MNRALRAALGIVGGILLAGQTASAAVTYADSNPLTTAIPGGNWAPVFSTPGGLYVLSIGNSYAHYDTTVAPYVDNLIVEGFAHSEVADVYWGIGSKHNTATVNPTALGGIASVDYSHTARKASLDGVATAILLIQNGKYYRSAFNVIPAGPTSSFLEFVGAGLTANAFGEFEGLSYDYANPPADGRANMLSNPDFSATGAPIQFGWLGHFQSGNGGYGGPNATLPPLSLASPGATDSPAAYLATTAFSITFNETPIPEPSTAAMLVGLCLIPALRRRRN